MNTPANEFYEEVELSGHIIDSLILPKILDEIIALGGHFDIQEIEVGKQRNQPSHARLRVAAGTAEKLDEILSSIGQHGARPVEARDCHLEQADMDGAFPIGFYSTTNQETEIRIKGEWIPVGKQEMDCGVRVDPETDTAECLPMSDVRKGDWIVIGRGGTRVLPLERDPTGHGAFSFMNSTVSSEKPKNVTVREIAAEMRKARDGQGKILIVGGPAIVHTGS